MVDAGLVRMPAAVVFVLNCGFMIAETFVTYEWFYFFESIQNSLFVEKKIIRALRSIPLVLMIVLCVHFVPRPARLRARQGFFVIANFFKLGQQLHGPLDAVAGGPVEFVFG